MRQLRGHVRPASDAVFCALDLQLAPSDPFSLCIGLHTIEMRMGESVATVSTDVAARVGRHRRPAPLELTN